jgi:hypothetical protein
MHHRHREVRGVETPRRSPSFFSIFAERHGRLREARRQAGRAKRGGMNSLKFIPPRLAEERFVWMIQGSDPDSMNGGA